MPAQKNKDEHFQNLGGINTKVSPYLASTLEFLNLVNFDFSTPGSLTKRWGSTQYIGLAVPNGKVTGLFEFDQFNGASRLVVTGSTLAYFVDGSSYTSFRAGATFAVDSPSFNIMGISSSYSFSVFNNMVYACNGKDHWKYDGNTSYLYSLPLFLPMLMGNTGYAATHFTSVIGNNAATGMSGWFFYVLGYLNTAGHLSPGALFTGSTIANYSGRGVTTLGVPSISGASGLYLTLESGGTVGKSLMQPGFGITAIVVYRGGPVPSGDMTLSPFDQAQRLPFYKIGYWGIGDTGFIDGNLSNGDPMPTSLRFELATYRRSGGSFIMDAAGQTLVPKFNEIYNNQYMMAGFSNAPSTIYWSEIGEPEHVEPENFAEARTNDGDHVTGIKSFLSEFVIFKERSVHRLSGSAPENLVLSQITSEYGCLNNRARAVYEQKLLFLDQKGIVEYNGANVQIISYKVQPFFDLMNVIAAKDHAVMAHFKQRNEIWCGIPYNGASTNNLTIVYDYIANAWTTFAGFNPGLFAEAQGTLSKKTTMYADYSGLIYNFSASFTADNGVGITTLFKTQFMADEGKTVQKLYRRLFMNLEPVGTTSTLSVNFYQDYGSSIVLTRTMYQNPYQSRIDFGISATAIAIQVSNFSTTDTVKIHGYTIEHRFQRMESTSV